MDNKNLNSYCNDIEIIKNTIERSKIDFSILSNFFMIYGAINLFIFTTMILCGRFFVYNGLSVLNIILPSVRYVLLAVMLVFYLKKYFKPIHLDCDLNAFS